MTRTNHPSSQSNKTTTTTTTTTLLNVTILDRGPYHIVVEKPPGVVCHHSDWSGSRSSSSSSSTSSSQQRQRRKRDRRQKKGSGRMKLQRPEDDDDEEGEEEEDVVVAEVVFPMLQRTREAVGGSRVNLVHRLDRGASGCLLLTYANTNTDTDTDTTTTATTRSSNEDIIGDAGGDDDSAATTTTTQDTCDSDGDDDGEDRSTAIISNTTTFNSNNNATAILQQAMVAKSSDDNDSSNEYDGAVVNFGRDSDSDSDSDSSSSSSQKTYLAFVRGECIVSGRDLRDVGWFKVDRPIKNERGNLKNATTYFRWIAGQDNDNGRLANTRPRMSLVLARPVTGRWHQIRKHLNGLSAPIIGDSTHGNSKTNREWRRLWNLPPERTCLHLLNLQLQLVDAALPPPNYHENDDTTGSIASIILPPSGKLNVSCPLLPDMCQMIHQDYILPEVIRDAKEAFRQEGLNPSLLDGLYDDTTNKRHEVVTIDIPKEHQ